LLRNAARKKYQVLRGALRRTGPSSEDPKISLVELEYYRPQQESKWTAKKWQAWKETTNSVSFLLHLLFVITVVICVLLATVLQHLSVNGH